MHVPTRVVLIDDHAILREGLALVIEHQSDLRCVGQASDRESALALFSRVRPDVCVIDVALGADDGLELLRSLRRVDEQAKAVVLTMHDDAQHLRAALDAGASGYVLKRQGASQLLEAIRAVAQGASYIDASFGAEPEPEPEPHEPSRLEGLTTRERQVLELVARGITHRAIADLLGIGKKSVDTYRSRVYQKLGIHSRAELVEVALQVGVLRHKLGET